MNTKLLTTAVALALGLTLHPAMAQDAQADTPAATEVKKSSLQKKDDTAPDFEGINIDRGSNPAVRVARRKPAAPEGDYRIFSDKPKQVIRGLGFEIQSDSIGSGNNGLPKEQIAVPHDLVPSERERLAKEMLKGFRYCRLAGGLYWRGTDAEGKFLQPRWPGQLEELKELLDTAEVESLMFEYWSPAPFWKANRQYIGKGGTENVLRCFGKDFADDPDYKGDKQKFLNDFGDALVKDVQTLKDAGFKISMWGLQNEPSAVNNGYSTCIYTSQEYLETFGAVAPKIRRLDPGILIYADSHKLAHAQPVLSHPEYSKFVDAIVIHHIGSNSGVIERTVKKIRNKYGDSRPIFQNEYEYFVKTSPHLCLNTVQHIMNWFQLGDAPTWFWIHALKPIQNSEASGYSLGFWRSLIKDPPRKTQDFADLQAGHWAWNKCNWHALASFTRHMPWDSRSVEVKEGDFDDDLRIMAFKRPNGKLTIILSNRSFTPHTFKVDTGLTGATFKGYRYTPDEAGENFMGVPIGTLQGGTIAPKLEDMTWEFWEQE